MILERTGIPGETLVYADVLHEGPVPGGLGADALARVRAKFLAPAPDGTNEADILASLLDADDRIVRHNGYDEVVFWFEHDLFDQLLLIRHLERLADVTDRAAYRLICVGSFPGHPRFAGLGELQPAELASLYPSRQPIGEEQVAVGATLWRAFVAPDPRGLSDLVTDGDTEALPFAAGALRRHLEDFPSTENGLSRTERQILTVVRDGQTAALDAFAAATRMEERVFMGDSVFFDHLERLTRGRAPLLAHDGTFAVDRPPSGTFTLTTAAHAVLEGRADYIALNGIDRWMGGVHVTDGRYRWNGAGVVVSRSSFVGVRLRPTTND